MAPDHWLRLVSFIALGLGTVAAGAGLFWNPAGALVDAPELVGHGLYHRDTPFTAGGAQAAAVGLWREQPWGMVLAIPLLAIAALLLPMMLAQTIMQLRAGVAFGSEAAAPLAGLSLIAAGAAWFLWRLARGPWPRSAADA